MELILFVYFIEFFANLKTAISIFLGILAIFLFFGVLNAYNELELNFLMNIFNKLTSSKLFYTFVSFLLCLLIFIPSKNTVMAMGGAYAASQAYAAAKESTILQKSLKLIENKIDESIKNSDDSLKNKE